MLYKCNRFSDKTGFRQIKFKFARIHDSTTVIAYLPADHADDRMRNQR